MTPAKPSALITPPPWLYGSDPGAFLRAAALRARGQAPGSWSVRTTEVETGQPPQLLSHQDVTGRWDVLTVRDPSEQPHLEKLARMSGQANWNAAVTLEQRLVALPSYLSTVPHSSLADRTNDARQRLDSDIGTTATRVTSILVDTSLNLRLALPRIMLRAADGASREELNALVAAGQHAFPAAAGLLEGYLLPIHFIRPLLLSHPCWIWAHAGSRERHVVLFLVDPPVDGRASSSPFTMLSRTSQPNHPPPTGDGLPALEWWVGRLNRLLSVVSDPSLFTTGPDRRYAPEPHLTALLTVHQAFDDVAAVLAMTDHAHGSRRLMFGFLDSMEYFTGQAVGQLMSPARARRVLTKLREDASLPALIYSACERGVNALERVGRGFIAAPQPPETDGVGAYFQALRNATHGFAPKGSTGEATRILTHDGTLPDDLPYLTVLYLADLLNRTHQVRLRLTAKSAAR